MNGRATPPSSRLVCRVDARQIAGDDAVYRAPGAHTGSGTSAAA